MSRERHEAVAGDALFFEALFTAQIEQVDDEGRIGDFTTQTTNQLHGGFNGAAGCQQIVNYRDFVARFDRINVISSWSVPYSARSSRRWFREAACAAYVPAQSPRPLPAQPERQTGSRGPRFLQLW